MTPRPTLTPTSFNIARKPKRPPTAYINFMKKFLRAQCIKSMKEGRTAVKAGAKQWSKMSDAEKSKYGKRCAKGRLLYNLEKTEYLRQLRAMRAPPRPYGAFVAYYFKECGSSIKSNKFVEVNRQALNVWQNLPPAEKDKYRNEFYQQYDDFCRRVCNQGNNSGDFVAAEKTSISANSDVGDATNAEVAVGSFDLRKIRREKRRQLLQQKLEREREREQRHESLITSRTSRNAQDTIQVQGTGSLVAQTSASNSNEGQDGTCASTSTSSEDRRESLRLRRRKDVEAKDERSKTSRADGNAKDLNLISENDKKSPSANSNGDEKNKNKNKNTLGKNDGEVEVKRKRGRPTLAEIALRNKNKQK